MTIGKKLTIGFAILLFVALALAGGYLYSVASLGRELKVATGATATKLYLATEVEAQLFRMRSCQRGVMLFMLENLPAKAQTNKQEFETRAAGVETLLAQITPLLHIEKAQQNAALIQTEFPNFKSYFEQVADAAMKGDAKSALTSTRIVPASPWTHWKRRRKI